MVIRAPAELQVISDDIRSITATKLHAHNTCRVIYSQSDGATTTPALLSEAYSRPLRGLLQFKFMRHTELQETIKIKTTFFLYIMGITV